MSLLWTLSILCGLLLSSSVGALNTRYCLPRKTVPYQSRYKEFSEEGITNYSTMLMREDLGVLLLGAREAIYALDINDVSDKKSAVYWGVTEEKQRSCANKGKQFEWDCRNYIRALHTLNDTTMFVCGTDAYSPKCDHLTFADGQLRLQGKQQDGKGKCPFDPFQRYSSILVESDLYSATSNNFLGSEPLFSRSSPSTGQPSRSASTLSTWLNDPNFVFMTFVAESVNSTDGDDDKVYLFFSEMENENENERGKVKVSRVARVCKGDVGGQRTLTRKWSTFLKARLDCSVTKPSLPAIVRDVFLLEHENWKDNIFYAIFSPQPHLTDVSAVCAFKMFDIRDIFNEGRFKKPVDVETSQVWVMNTGHVPVPRPGACINDEARKRGYNNSKSLPDKTLQVVRDHPVMYDAVPPLTGGPLLVRKGPSLTRIVVDSVTALDKQNYHVMFMGTDNGYVQKAVKYAEETFIIEELQLYKDPEPIIILRLSSSKGQIYAGSMFAVVQIPLSDCKRHATCMDCILARDPYCAWDFTGNQCSSVHGLNPKTAIQSLKDGDVSLCPTADPVAAVDLILIPKNNIRLPCQLHSNLAKVHWRLHQETLQSNHKYVFYSGGLLILDAAESDAGLYSCDSVEHVNNRVHNRTVAVYRLQPYSDVGPGFVPTTNPTTSNSSSNHSPSKDITDQELKEMQTDTSRITRLQVGVGLLTLISLCLIGVIAWMWTRQSSTRQQRSGKPQVWARFLKRSGQKGRKRPSNEGMHIQNTAPAENILAPTPNNNHTAVDFKGNGLQLATSMANISCLDGLGYINDESEI
ncbi:semaphorin-4E-like [Genypterus blacodes]|uniref:semaphorin-4E-like n=1 Tax=Genypterus blacodes TaxID=154954 RepID=UPI003F76D1BF